jgi:predicted NBD/HSP70 family sugar kinase
MAAPLEFWQASDVLRAKLRDTNMTGLPIIFENDEATQASQQGMIYCEVSSVGSEQATINAAGLREFRDYGVFTIAVCIPRGAKVSQAEQWAAAIRTKFNPDLFADTSLRITDRRIMKAEVQRRDSRWHSVGVAVSFHCTRLE